MTDRQTDRMWSGVWGLMLLAFTLRVVFALVGRNIHHPDEVFQYLEQAHRLVFGNGLVPWEFRFGTRSWIVPFLIGGPLALTEWLGLDRPAIYIPLVKIVCCALSTSVVPLVYFGTRRLVSEDAGRLAAAVAAIWYELIYFSYRPTPDVLSAYLLLAGLVLATGVRWRTAPLWLGLSLAGAVALRTQLVPLVGLVLLVGVWRWTWRQRFVTIAVGALVLVGVGAVDRLTWGSWFASYVNNYTFNVTYGVSALFGVSNAFAYVGHLLITSAGAFVVAAVWSARWWRRLWLPLSVVVPLVASHSVIAHKEYRFIVAGIPLLIMLWSSVVVLATESSDPGARRVWRRAAGVAIVLVSVAGSLNWLPSQQRTYRTAPLFAADPSLDAYVRLSEDPTLTALFVADEQWWYSGGYYFLHRDVPVYFVSDVEAMIRESGAGPEAYASHVLHRGEGVATPGFEVVTRLGPVSILRNVTGMPLRTLQSYSRQMPQDEIDSVYQPTVQPFLTPPR